MFNPDDLANDTRDALADDMTELHRNREDISDEELDSFCFDLDEDEPYQDGNMQDWDGDEDWDADCDNF